MRATTARRSRGPFVWEQPEVPEIAQGVRDMMQATVIAGEEYTVNAMSDSDCVIIPFETEGQRFLVGLKISKDK